MKKQSWKHLFIVLTCALSGCLLALTACAKPAPAVTQYLTEQDRYIMVGEDWLLLQDYLNSLAKSSYGKNCLAEFYDSFIEPEDLHAAIVIVTTGVAKGFWGSTSEKIDDITKSEANEADHHLDLPPIVVPLLTSFEVVPEIWTGC